MINRTTRRTPYTNDPYTKRPGNPSQSKAQTPVSTTSRAQQSSQKVQQQEQDSSYSNNNTRKIFKDFKPSHPISIIELRMIQDAYALYCDTVQPYLLDRAKAGNVLRSVGIVIGNIPLNNIMIEKKITEPKINMDRLLELYYLTKYSRGDVSQVMGAVNMLSGGKGEISVGQLRKDLTVLGDVMTQKEFSDAMKILGIKGGNGMVDCEKLVTVLTSVQR